MINASLSFPNGRVIQNRIVKSAMSEALADRFNNPTDALIDIYRRWGKGGAGMLIAGNTPIDRWHLEHAGNFVLDEYSDRDKVRALTRAAKSGGSLFLAQLAHAGRQTPAAINPHPLSISDIRLQLDGYGEPVAATDQQLDTVINQFAKSAVIAQETGFDGVEIHAAHGYLLSSSLSPRINIRADRWGGDLQNRARLLLSVIRAVRAVVGKTFLVAVKLNSSDFQKGGFSHQDSLQVALALEAEGVDFIEISGGNFEAPVSYQYKTAADSTRQREAYFLEYAQDIKAALDIPVMTTGGFRSVGVMKEALKSGQTDLLGIGRPFIVDPDFPKKVLDGSIDIVPAIERDMPPADILPAGAALNWFCHQLFLQGTTGAMDGDLPVLEGHQQYLAQIKETTAALIAARDSTALDFHR